MPSTTPYKPGHRAEERKALQFARDLIQSFDLDLTDLCVYTEAATGPYRFTPLVCALAGARRVFALARDTAHGTADEAVARTEALAGNLGLSKPLRFSREKRPEDLARADIVTNSGNVRPIDAATVAMLRPTCVVPLMWETWEFRPEEVDLAACRRRGVLVLGTDEEAFRFRRYTGELFLRMVHTAGLTLDGCRMFYFGHPLVAHAVGRALEANGGQFRWTGTEDDPNDVPGRVTLKDKETLLRTLAWATVFVADDRTLAKPLVGPGGVFTTQELLAANSDLTILNRSGVLDHEGLAEAGLQVVPQGRYENGYLGFTTAMLGYRPAMEMAVAGLKVGEVMARARLGGMSPEESAEHALTVTCAMDFPGPLSQRRKEV